MRKQLFTLFTTFLKVSVELNISNISPGLQKGDVLISAESYLCNEEIKDTISSSSVNCKSIQHKEHHCLKNVAC